MNKTIFIILIGCICKMLAAQNYEQNAPILRQDNEVHVDGSHNYLYETGNGIYEDQQGYHKDPATQAVQGQYQYQTPEGNFIRVVYTADENGYRPQGDHLPTPPPIPPEIQKALDILATLPPRPDEI